MFPREPGVPPVGPLSGEIKSSFLAAMRGEWSCPAARSCSRNSWGLSTQSPYTFISLGARYFHHTTNLLDGGGARAVPGS